jgi:hypothetical protein
LPFLYVFMTQLWVLRIYEILFTACDWTWISLVCKYLCSFQEYFSLQVLTVGHVIHPHWLSVLQRKYQPRPLLMCLMSLILLLINSAAMRNSKNLKMAGSKPMAVQSARTRKLMIMCELGGVPIKGDFCSVGGVDTVNYHTRVLQTKCSPNKKRLEERAEHGLAAAVTGRGSSRDLSCTREMITWCTRCDVDIVVTLGIGPARQARVRVDGARNCNVAAVMCMVSSMGRIELKHIGFFC